jgi:hypothetical protein
MKIQDIKQDSKFTHITYAVVSVAGVSGFSSAINTSERNVTKKVISIDDNITMRYKGTVEQFRKTIITEDGKKIRLFWFNGEKSNCDFSVYRKAI